MSKKRRLHVKRKSDISLTPDKGTYVHRIYKDKLFRYIFRDKKKLLQLYNAVSGSCYEDVEELTVTTVENVIYLGYKNDLSFILDWVLCLIEHQSSWNPNIPLRGVLYFARLYKDFIESGGYNLYGTKHIRLPFPQYIVFYNGTSERPEREVLRLSDAFEIPKHLAQGLAVPALECQALVLNINYGKNQELLSKCRPLFDYSRFIFYIRQNYAQGIPIEKAVDMAVERCLRENVMTDVLTANRREVVGMFLEEFDEEAYYRALKKEGWEDGRIEGLAEGKAEDILDLLADLGEVPENLKEEIMGQKDFDILSRWLKAAARSGSIEEFVGRM